jgi:hypothetical protein
MVFNIVIVSVLVILIIHYSIDYLKTFLNPSPPILEDLKYKKYKAMIDEISRPRPHSDLTDNIDLTVGDLTVGDLTVGDLSVGDLSVGDLSVGDLSINGVADLDKAFTDDTVSEDLGQYFNLKIAEE